MIEQLFGSKTRVKLLQLFYKNPNRSFYVREITRKIDEQINSVRRELANLLSIGIISSDNSNNKLYYEVNQNFEHYDALASVFGGKKLKTKKPKAAPDQSKKEAEEADNKALVEDVESADHPIVEALKRAGNIRLVVITGQFTLDDRAGVDLALVGDLNETNLAHAISELESQEKKEIKYVFFDPQEFVYRKQVNDKFVSNLMVSKKIVLLDKDSLM